MPFDPDGFELHAPAKKCIIIMKKMNTFSTAWRD